MMRLPSLLPTASDDFPGRTDGKRLATLFLPSLARGGAEKAVLELSGALVEHGWDVDLVVTRQGGVHWDAIPANVQLVNLQSWKVVTSLPKLVRYLWRERPDVLITSLAFSNLTAIVAKRWFALKVRLVVRIDANLSSQFRFSPPLLRAAIRLFRQLLPAANAVVAVSDEVAEDTRRSVPEVADRVQVIYNPVVTPALEQQAQEPVFHPWLNDPHTPVIVTSGRFVEQKDHDTLLRAFARLNDSYPARLIVLGKGPKRHRLESLARRLGVADRVDFPGFQMNPFAYMARAAMFVLSSRWEGLPTVIIEAMVCGTPVVSTACQSGPSEILDGGKYGRLVPVGDWCALAAAMEDMLLHPENRETLIERSHLYSREASVSRYLTLLNSLTGIGLYGGGGLSG